MKVSSLIVFLLLSLSGYAQYSTYQYSQELLGVSDQWHRIELPDELFSRVEEDFSDVRIVAVNADHDTTEVPYVLKALGDRSVQSDIQFKILNRSSNANGHYFTFEVNSEEAINKIDLDFKQTNFDWLVKLEGSPDQTNWFTIIKDHRILSIKNEAVGYHFTTLNFSPAKYRYYRLFIPGPEKSDLQSARITSSITTTGKSRSYPLEIYRSDVEPKTKQTIITARLPASVPINKLSITFNDTVDFYRDLTLDFLKDTAESEAKDRIPFRKLCSGTVSSLESNSFNFPTEVVSVVQLRISDRDNEPLSVRSVTAMGDVYELVARFPQGENFILLYGNKKALAPDYDLEHFADRIPNDVKSIKLGEVKERPRPEVLKVKPLFENEVWLWLVMGIIVLLLGGFTIKMLSVK